MSGELESVKAAITAYKFKDIEGIVKNALDAGVDPNDILNNGMITAMTEIGEGFKENRIFMPQMLVAAKTMQKGVDVLKPYLKGGEAAYCGKIIIGSVLGDVHDIGKNLVAMMCEGAGMQVTDLGADVPAERFLDAIASNQDIGIVACSSSMTTTREATKKLAEAIKSSKDGARVKFMVGGATMTQEFADEIGADGYTADATSASKMAKGFMGGA